MSLVPVFSLTYKTSRLNAFPFPTSRKRQLLFLQLGDWGAPVWIRNPPPPLSHPNLRQTLTTSPLSRLGLFVQLERKRFETDLKMYLTLETTDYTNLTSCNHRFIHTQNRWENIQVVPKLLL